jgi:hypothetical protein
MPKTTTPEQEGLFEAEVHRWGRATKEDCPLLYQAMFKACQTRLSVMNQAKSDLKKESTSRYTKSKAQKILDDRIEITLCRANKPLALPKVLAKDAATIIRPLRGLAMSKWKKQHPSNGIGTMTAVSGNLALFARGTFSQPCPPQPNVAVLDHLNANQVCAPLLYTHLMSEPSETIAYYRLQEYNKWGRRGPTNPKLELKERRQTLSEVNIKPFVGVCSLLDPPGFNPQAICWGNTT